MTPSRRILAQNPTTWVIGFSSHFFFPRSDFAYLDCICRVIHFLDRKMEICSSNPPHRLRTYSPTAAVGFRIFLFVCTREPSVILIFAIYLVSGTYIHTYVRDPVSFPRPLNSCITPLCTSNHGPHGRAIEIQTPRLLVP